MTNHVEPQADASEPRQFLREPSEPSKAPELHAKRIPLAGGWQKVDADYGDIGADVEPIDFEANVWDCPACGSLLLAINPDYAFRTHDNDPVRCPVCGDASVRIHSSGFPEVTCLIDGMERVKVVDHHDPDTAVPWVSTSHEGTDSITEED